VFENQKLQLKKSGRSEKVLCFQSEMMSEKKKYIEELLVKLEDKSLRPGLEMPEELSLNSELTVAHEAREEINALEDEAYIPVFQELLVGQKVAKNKINLIRYLIRLADKLDRNEIADYVLNLVREEKGRWVNELALKGLNLSSLKVDKETELLFELAEHKDWQIRFDSLRLLSKLPKEHHERIEALCLDQCEKYKSNNHSLRVLAATLSKVGSSKSMPALRKIISNSTKVPIAISAISAIHEIEGATELKFYIKCFTQNKNSQVKSKLIELIAQYGDEKQKLIMIKRVQALLIRERKTNWAYTSGAKPELVTIIKFLDKHALVDSNNLLQWIVAKKLRFLDETESAWVKGRTM